MKKLVALLLSIVMLSTALAAVAEGTTFTALYAGEVSTLNYLTTGSTWDQQVGANVIDTLVEYNSTGEVQPSLAESWESNEDATVWTFHLRQGQKWYDTAMNAVADVTANDFVAAAKYVLTPEYASSTASVLYVLEGAEAYYEAASAGEEVDFATVGVKALDDYTLEYTLSGSTPYFLSMLTYVCFMPAYGPQLEELGADFGTAADKMYYNGAYILTSFEPQVGHVYTKNANNWDADNIFIEEIDRVYNAEASVEAPQWALQGEADEATIDNDVLDDYKANFGDQLSRERVTVDYSYFYCFNFDPNYDEAYGPANWLIAVNNSNFRKSIMKAFDRLYTMTALEPDDPEALLQNTITPATFCAVDGKDFAALDAFADIADCFYTDESSIAEAQAYRDAAITELTAAGCTFPVTILLTYKSGDSDWENESVLVKQVLESALGTDYINVELYAGPSDGFLGATRRSGVYSIMRCNWGADYADPETFSEPFDEKIDPDTGLHAGRNYCFMDKMLDTDNEETKAILTEYYADVAAAEAITTDTEARYNAFATAEAWLIKNAMVIPYNVDAASYQLTKLNIFESQYASFGISTLRYKGMHVYDDFITAEEYEANYDAWKAAMGL